MWYVLELLHSDTRLFCRHLYDESDFRTYEALDVFWPSCSCMFLVVFTVLFVFIFMKTSQESGFSDGVVSLTPQKSLLEGFSDVGPVDQQVAPLLFLKKKKKSPFSLLLGCKTANLAPLSKYICTVSNQITQIIPDSAELFSINVYFFSSLRSFLSRKSYHRLHTQLFYSISELKRFAPWRVILH